ncbi:MAG: mercury transporter MerT [Betaproteobacteria bacterium]|nr:MAG: mercury transporter MerT [Betaproteobacteria bacterium]
MKLDLSAGGALVGGALASIGASLCCVGPLVLVSLGIGGAWVSSLTTLEPARPIFMLATVALFGAAYWKLYRAPEVCKPDEACADPRVRGRQRTIFWAMLVVVAPLLTFPWYAPLFY